MRPGAFARRLPRHDAPRRDSRAVGLPAVTVDTPRPVAVIGASLDLGAGRRGVDMGPSAIRYAGLEARLTEIGCTAADWGNVATAVPEAAAVGDERVRFLREIEETCSQVADLVG